MNNTYTVKIIFFLTLFILFMGVNMHAEQDVFKNMEDVTDEQWEKLAKTNIYFGHQSVGFNIIDGIEEIIRENDKINLIVTETSEKPESESYGFAHSQVGKNRYPYMKIDEFSENIQNGLGNSTDIAFVKLCYVDAYKDTDVNNIFKHYNETLSILREQYPKTTFVHLTMPIMVQEKGVKGKMKRLLGKHAMGYEDNLRREQYNMMIRNEYSGREPLFDIALIESTRSDGTREVYEKNGEKYYALVPEYSSDGGHLNEMGRRVVAEQLLIFLATITDKM